MIKRVIGVVVLTLSLAACGGEIESQAYSLTPSHSEPAGEAADTSSETKCQTWEDWCKTTTSDPAETAWIVELIRMNPNCGVIVSNGNATVTNPVNEKLDKPPHQPAGIQCGRTCLDP